MEYVYAAMLLHSAKKEINDAAVKKVLEAAGIQVDEARVKALVASLKDINIDEAIQKAAIATPVAVAPATTGAAATEAKKEAKQEDNKKTEEEAAEGLGSLFG